MSGVSGEGVSGDGESGEGVSGEGLSGDGESDEGVSGEGVSGGGLSAGTVRGQGPECWITGRYSVYSLLTWTPRAGTTDAAARILDLLQRVALPHLLLRREGELRLELPPPELFPSEARQENPARVGRYILDLGSGS